MLCAYEAIRRAVHSHRLAILLFAGTLTWTAVQAGGGEHVRLVGSWTFAQTAYPAPSPAAFDTLDWQPQQVPGMLEVQPDKGTVGLYRTHFDYPHDPFDKTLDVAVYISNIRHGDRVWLNRQQIGATGTLPAPWQFQQNNSPQSLSRLYSIPDDLLRDEDNEIVVEVSLGFGDAPAALYPGGTGITQGEAVVGDRPMLQTWHSSGKLRRIAVDAVFVVLGIIDVILITFLLPYALNRLPGYLWLVINSMMMLVASGAQDIFFVFDFGVLGSNSSFIVIMLMLPLVNALFFWSARKDLPLHLVYFAAVLSVTVTALICLPHQWLELKRGAWFVYMASAAGFYAYCLYAAGDNVVRKRTGSALQLFGLLFYLVSIRSQWLPEGLFDHRNIQIGTMVFRYFLFFSYVRQFMEIKQGYNAAVEKILSIDKTTRSAIAMELHDGVIQRLASIRLLSQLLKKDSASPSEHLHTLSAEVDSAIASIRSTMEHTHDRCFENFSMQQILRQDALRLQNIYQCRLTWELDSGLEAAPLATHQWVHIYRIMHECVLNAIKHGGADNIHLTGKARSGLLVFTVANDGRAFTLQQTRQTSGFGSGHGWTAIRERVSLLKGEITVYSNAQQHSVVELRCPAG